MEISWGPVLFFAYEAVLFYRAVQVNKDRPDQSLVGALFTVNLVGPVLAPYVLCELIAKGLMRFGQDRTRAVLQAQYQSAAVLYEVGTSREQDRIERELRRVRLLVLGMVDAVSGRVGPKVAKVRAKLRRTKADESEPDGGADGQ